MISTPRLKVNMLELMLELMLEQLLEQILLILLELLGRHQIIQQHFHNSRFCDRYDASHQLFEVMSVVFIISKYQIPFRYLYPNCKRKHFDRPYL